MKTVHTTRHIAAPLSLVFKTISDVRNFSKAVPNITNIEFLTERQEGPGTRFRETRIMNGREATVELEVTELVENEHVRIVSDAGGTRWDTVFRVTPQGGNVELEMVMNANEYKLLAKLFNPLIRGMVVKGVESDMDAVKEYCEANANSD